MQVSFPVRQRPQEIAFNNSPSRSDFLVFQSVTANLTGGGSGSPVSLSVDTAQTIGSGTVCSVSGNVVKFGPGTGHCAIHAHQDPGPTGFYAPGDATEVFNVHLSSIVLPNGIVFIDPESAVGVYLPVESSIGRSGQPVVFSVDAGRSTTNAGTLGQQQRTTDPTTGKPVYKVTVHPVHAGLCVVDAFEDGNSKYDFGFASTGITVDTGNQGVTFTNTIPSPAAIGDSFEPRRQEVVRATRSPSRSTPRQRTGPAAWDRTELPSRCRNSAHVSSTPTRTETLTIIRAPTPRVSLSLWRGRRLNLSIWKQR